MTSLREFWKLLTKPFIKHETQKEDKGYQLRSHRDSKEDLPQNEELIKLSINKDQESPSIIYRKENSLQTKPIERQDPTALIQHKADKVYIQVGIDFGTSTTKIMYSQIGKRLSRVIRFNHELPTYPDYCLPSIVAIDEQKNLLLGIEAADFLLDREWDTGFQRLKVVVAGNYDQGFRDNISHAKYYKYCADHGLCETITPERLTAVFLAYAIHTAREAITKRPEYSNVELDLAFNICMPIDHVENKTLNEVFEKIFSWAEQIEKEWINGDNEFDPLSVSYQVENIRIENQRVFAIPESVAAMASYLVSLRREEGIHAFIDFGAGTTDVSICNLTLSGGGANSYWFAARNIPSGTIRIERRFAELIESDPSCSLCTNEDICTCLEGLTNQLIQQRQGVSAVKNSSLQSIVLEELCKFRNSNEYRQTWGSAYKNHMNIETAFYNVNIFISGGGSNLPHLKETFAIPWWQHLSRQGIRYPISFLPVPNDYDRSEGNVPFERMAVAYGLTIPKPELDVNILPADSPNQTPILNRRPLRNTDDYYT